MPTLSTHSTSNAETLNMRRTRNTVYSSRRRESRPSRNAADTTPMAFGEGLLEVSRILAAGMFRHKQREMKRSKINPRISANGLAKLAGKSVNVTNAAPD